MPHYEGCNILLYTLNETDRAHFILKVEILSLTHLIEIARTRP
jgi:hypothetical protein